MPRPELEEYGPDIEDRPRATTATGDGETTAADIAVGSIAVGGAAAVATGALAVAGIVTGPVGWIVLGVGLLAGGAFFGSQAAGLAADAEKSSAQAEIDQNLKDAEIKENARLAALEATKTQMGLKFDQDKKEALDAAADLRTNTRLGFTSAMNDTYLGQMQAEAGYTDMLQKGAETKGGLASANAVAGSKQNTTAASIISSQIAAQQQTARTQIDRGMEGNVAQAKGQADLQMGKAQRVEDAFGTDGGYTQLYNAQLASLESESGFNAQLYDSQKTYLDTLRAGYDSTAWQTAKAINMAVPYVDFASRAVGMFA